MKPEILQFSTIVLLVINLIFGLVLAYRLAGFKEARRDMIRAADQFRQLLEGAQGTLTQMKQSTEHMSKQLQSEVGKATHLRDDLVMALDKATKPAPTFTKPKSEPVRPSVTFANIQSIDAYQSEAERELFEALQRLKKDAS